MTGWLLVAIGLAIWIAAAIPTALLVSRLLRWRREQLEREARARYGPAFDHAHFLPGHRLPR